MVCSRAYYTLIAGSIPPEIGNLRALKILNVQNNSLHGEWRTQIIRSNHGVSLRCRKVKKGLALGKAKGRHQRCCKCTQLLCVPGALKGKGKYCYVVVVGNSREISRKLHLAGLRGPAGGPPTQSEAAEHCRRGFATGLPQSDLGGFCTNSRATCPLKNAPDKSWLLVSNW